MITRKNFLIILGFGIISLISVSCAPTGYVTKEQAEEIARAAADQAVKTALAAIPSATPLNTTTPTEIPSITPTSSVTPTPTPINTPTVTPLPTQASYWWPYYYYYYPPPPPPPTPHKSKEECPPGNHCDIYWEKVKKTPTPSPTPHHHHHP